MHVYAMVCKGRQMNKDFYSIKEFAKKLDVSVDTIRRGIRNGRIAAFRAGGSSRGVFRIAASEITRMAEIDLQSILRKMAKE